MGQNRAAAQQDGDGDEDKGCKEDDGGSGACRWGQEHR